MKNRVRFLILGGLALFSLSCGSTKDLLPPLGDGVTITTLDGRTHSGEFLWVDSTTVYILVVTKGKPGQKVCFAPISSLKSLRVSGYSNREWTTSLLLFQVLPTIVLAVEAASYTHDKTSGPILLILGAPTVLTWVLLEASTPPDPAVHMPFLGMDEILKYARFPKGLTDDQRLQFLQSFGQTEAEVLP